MDVMVGLLAHHCLVRLPVKLVAAAAELVRAVVFESHLSLLGGPHKGTEAQGLRLQLRYLGKAVAVVVISVSHAVLPEYKHAHAVVGAHHRGIERSVVVEGAGDADRRQCVRCLGTVVQRVFGNDVYRAANGRRAKQRRTAATHNLNTLNHVGRNLFEAVYAGEGRKNRARVHQYLRVMAVEAVYAHLCETTVLAVVFNAHAGLVVESVGQTGRVDNLQCGGPDHTYQRRRVAPPHFGTVAGDYHLLEIEGVRL